MKSFIDKYLDFTISKKLTVFVIACVGLFSGVIESAQWTNISIMYIGTQGILDIILKLREKKNSQLNSFRNERKG